MLTTLFEANQDVITMLLLSDIPAVRAQINLARTYGSKIGLVPTMGALHEGHISLVKIAKEYSQYVVMSIFVNPTQFNSKEDLEKYPRSLERDAELAREAGVDLIFAPSSDAIYPRLGLRKEGKEEMCVLRAGQRSWPLEGVFRPGHFDGVVTVVSLLFNIVTPDVAIFGDKDYQQVKVIEELVRDLHYGIRIVTGDLIRESDGLAMSSRNERLSKEGRERALVISKSLFKAKDLVKNGARVSQDIIAYVKDGLERGGVEKIDYVEVVDIDSLESLEKVSTKAQLLLACYVDGVRLIDNVRLET